MSDKLLGLVFAALGLVILTLSLQLPAPIAATRIAYGAGFFPTILGVIVCITGVALMLKRSVPDEAEDEEEDVSGGNSYVRPAIVFLAALVYILFSQQIGFLLLAPVILAGLLMMGGVGPVRSALIGVIGSIIVYFLFAKLLLVPLPRVLLTPLGGFI